MERTPSRETKSFSGKVRLFRDIIVRQLLALCECRTEVPGTGGLCSRVAESR